MAQTGYEGLQKAVQDAFDTYWRRRKWREERVELGEGRQHEADMMMSRLKAGAAEGALGREAAAAEGRLGRGLEEDLATKQMDLSERQQTERLKSDETIARENRALQESLDKKGARREAIQNLMQITKWARDEAKLAQDAFDAGWETFKTTDLGYNMTEEKYNRLARMDPSTRNKILATMAARDQLAIHGEMFAEFEGDIDFEAYMEKNVPNFVPVQMERGVEEGLESMSEAERKQAWHRKWNPFSAAYWDSLFKKVGGKTRQEKGQEVEEYSTPSSPYEPTQEMQQEVDPSLRERMGDTLENAGEGLRGLWERRPRFKK